MKQLLLLTILSSILFSCSTKQAEVEESRTKSIVVVDSSISENIDASEETEVTYPETIYGEDRIIDNKPCKGIYQYLSSTFCSVDSVVKVIEPAMLTDTTLLYSPHCYYLDVDSPIILFKTPRPRSMDDVAGILKQGSIVYVDTMYYNKFYSPEGEWESFPWTFDYWYSIEINGTKYYTDHKLHNYISFQQYIPSKKQFFLIASQGSGYDGDYDRGYPSLYKALVFRETKQGWELFYRSGELLLNPDDDEYGYGLPFSIDDTFLDEKGNIFISDNQYATIVWDGVNLMVEEYGGNEENLD